MRRNERHTMLRLADAWTWDFWLADDGRAYHLYFLKAPRHIGHPGVFADRGGDGWHMLLTARACDGTADQRGVIGHARSYDLVHWQAQPPLSRPGGGFGHLEVPQVEVVAGRPVLVFSCLGAGLSDERRKAGMPGGIWCLPRESLLGPFTQTGLSA